MVIISSGGIIQLYLISPQLTGLVILIVPPISALVALSSKRERRMWAHASTSKKATHERALKVVSELVTVQAYAQEEGERSRHSALLDAEMADEGRCLLFHQAWVSAFQAC